eukprot:TRINITY_DN20019_c0_g1_i1.p1 TRINITY_DN20019_c0_g1~~TRINITY_DN20019_c0_g1_i1.p1  ORF type:complete len:542 (-),score=127.73 TRINITY_DN20019_c0_g1_i1:100-1725(-)
MMKKPASVKMHPASLAEFFQFLQCQIRMESKAIIGTDLALKDAKAEALWDEYEAFVKPNMGKNERWVPYHTAFGVHEFFLIESVHHRKAPGWNEKRRFLTIFVFRAHCKRDFFTEAQLPHLLKESFWKDPIGQFRPGGPLEKSMMDYRRRTGLPLQTLCFRMIPERILKDDDENLVRNIVLRTQRLLEVAERIWPVLKDSSKKASEKFNVMSEELQKARGLGETWAKMLSVCVDLAYPKYGILASQCDVGIGAQAPLRCLLEQDAIHDAGKALQTLQAEFNKSSTPSAKHFWGMLAQEEELARKKFKDLPLILEQMKSTKGKLSAVTLQVQLCEYRQFRNAIARSRYGLELDESMQLPEREKRLRPEDFYTFDEKTQTLNFEFPSESKVERFSVPLKGTHGVRRLAERVAAHCFGQFQGGATLAATEAYRDELFMQCRRGAEDVHPDSEAWRNCRVNVNYTNALAGFSVTLKNGTKLPFQTTVSAAGGNIMETERICRLCYEKLAVKGRPKDEVLSYRADLYAKSVAQGGEPPAKKPRLTA